jgi:hypothetical protein
VWAVTDVRNLLDAYLARVESLRAEVTKRLRPGASAAELDAAARAFGRRLHADVVAWYAWRNGVFRDRETRISGDLGESLLPWGQQVSLPDALHLEQGWYDYQAFGRSERSRRGTERIMHDAGFPILNDQWRLVSVECANGPGEGVVWVQQSHDPIIYTYPSVVELLERAIEFYDRGWLIRNERGGIEVADASVLGAWAEAAGLPNPPPRNWEILALNIPPLGGHGSRYE